MKKIEDDDLIITNEIDSSLQLPQEGEDIKAEDKADDKAQEHHDDTPSLREALSTIHEAETEKPQRMTLNKILVGDFFTAQILRRQLGIILTCAIIILIYISNRYSCQKKMIEIDKLKKELQDAKYKALSTSSRLTEKSRQSNVLDMLKECRDSSLHTSDQAPYIIKVPE